MSQDVYRTSGYSCPACGAPLREFQTRLVCDECGGMLLAIDDFRSACADMAGADLDVTPKREKPSNKRCPQCTRTMTACDLEIGKLEQGDWLRCEQHGLWCSKDRLTAVFAKVARKYFKWGAAPYFDAAGGHTRKAYPQGGGKVGRAATDGLSITAWRDRPRKRAKTMTPINVYADQTLRCPACSDRALVFMGDRWACEGCRGLFVQTATLAALVAEMTGQPWQVPTLAGAAGKRACPVCTAPMTEELLDAVALDACSAHGVWFDPQELEAVLVNEDRAVHPGGIRGWLRRLF